MAYVTEDKNPVKPRKLPTQARARATYDAILEATAQVLAGEGIDSLNTNASDYFTEIQGKVGNRSAFEAIDFVYENLPVFMDSADYKTIENRLQPDSLKLQLESSYKNLNSPFGMISRWFCMVLRRGTQQTY